MNKIDFGQTVNTLANIGVIAGIVFLAIEVRQNQATLEQSNVMNAISLDNVAQEHFFHFRSMILENADLFDVWERGLAGVELSEADEAKFGHLCEEHIFRMATSYRVRVRTDPETDFTGAPDLVRSLINRSPAYSRCWGQLRTALQLGDFVEKVESELK